jgi:hypothetical protein
MRGDYTAFLLIGLAVALFISILTARSNSNRANREQADRIKAQGEVRQKSENENNSSQRRGVCLHSGRGGKGRVSEGLEVAS